MKQNRKSHIIPILIILLIFSSFATSIVYFTNYTRNTDKSELDISKHYVAVIAKSTTSAFWKSVRAGTNAASTEYNLTMTFEGPENEVDYEEQNTLIHQAVKNGAKAIVFSASDFNGNAQAINDAARQGVKIVVIDSDVNSNLVSCRISTDNYRAGYMAGRASLTAKEDSINIGIVNFEKNSANGQQREEGFRDAVALDQRAKIVDAVNANSTTEAAQSETIKMLKEHPEINVITALNEWTSLGAGNAIAQLKLEEQTTVVAFDSNIISVGMLETGEVDALIVQDPFAMGYLGVECAYNLIQGIEPEAQTVDTATTLVTRDNMFEEGIQRIIFPFN